MQSEKTGHSSVFFSIQHQVPLNLTFGSRSEPAHPSPAILEQAIWLSQMSHHVQAGLSDTFILLEEGDNRDGRQLVAILVGDARLHFEHHSMRQFQFFQDPPDQLFNPIN
jgi:hypothetical protein